MEGVVSSSPSVIGTRGQSVETLMWECATRRKGHSPPQKRDVWVQEDMLSGKLDVLQLLF